MRGECGLKMRLMCDTGRMLLIKHLSLTISSIVCLLVAVVMFQPVVYAHGAPLNHKHYENGVVEYADGNLGTLYEEEEVVVEQDFHERCEGYNYEKTREQCFERNRKRLLEADYPPLIDRVRENEREIAELKQMVKLIIELLQTHFKITTPTQTTTTGL